MLFERRIGIGEEEIPKSKALIRLSSKHHRHSGIFVFVVV